MSDKKISVIEMPLDFGASRHGSDMGPSAIRLAGLADKLEELGFSIEKYDCPIQINPKEYKLVKSGKPYPQEAAKHSP